MYPSGSSISSCCISKSFSAVACLGIWPSDSRPCTLSFQDLEMAQNQWRSPQKKWSTTTSLLSHFVQMFFLGMMFQNMNDRGSKNPVDGCWSVWPHLLQGLQFTLGLTVQLDFWVTGEQRFYCSCLQWVAVCNFKRVHLNCHDIFLNFSVLYPKVHKVGFNCPRYWFWISSCSSSSCSNSFRAVSSSKIWRCRRAVTSKPPPLGLAGAGKRFRLRSWGPKMWHLNTYIDMFLLKFMGCFSEINLLEFWFARPLLLDVLLIILRTISQLHPGKIPCQKAQMWGVPWYSNSSAFPIATPKGPARSLHTGYSQRTAVAETCHGRAWKTGPWQNLFMRYETFRRKNKKNHENSRLTNLDQIFLGQKLVCFQPLGPFKFEKMRSEEA